MARVGRGIHVDDATDIGFGLVAELRDTLNDQVHKSIARHIHTKVRDARNDPEFAARRWPFELIQNAHDAGPRNGRDGVSLSFSLVDGVLRFEHDAAPFSMGDIAALLTGGSSKDFTSRITTGRFGTGFLVTHVLSERVQVFGVLEIRGLHRAFTVELDRPDDENLILDNIKESEDALGQTTSISDFDLEPTAAFEYVVDDNEAALAGLRSIEQSLPHLFGTCRRLREITIERDGETATWRSAACTEALDASDRWKAETNVSFVGDTGASAEWRLVSVATTETARGRLVVALEREGDGWIVRKPGEVPSVFRQLPLLGGPSLPMWAIVDGEFDVEQERRSIHVIGDAGLPLREAFAAIGPLVLLANEEGWANAYRLAQLALPAEGVGETALKVWRDIMSEEAAKLARLPIVRTVSGDMLPSVWHDDETRAADFIRRPPSGPSYTELWELAATCTENDPPVKGDSEGWSEIAEGWEELGVEVHWIDLPLIGERVASEVSDVSKLPIVGSPYHWLAHYLAAVGRTWKATGGVTKSHVAKLLPDQHGKLRGAGDLRRDGGVSGQTKGIGASVGLDFKAKLLGQQIMEAISSSALGVGLASSMDGPSSAASSLVTTSGARHLWRKLRAQKASEAALYAIGEVTGDELDEGEAVDDLVKHLSVGLPEDHRVTEKDEDLVLATLALLKHLWTVQGEAAREIAWGIPLLVADGTVRKMRLRRLMVLPSATWPERARPFAEIYPPARLLADNYADPEVSLSEALVSWGIAHSGLLVMSKREELRDRGLRAIAADPNVITNAALQSTEWMQIALLEPEVLNHCKQSRELASALLGFVVCFAAAHDASWRSTVEVSVRAPEGVKRVRVTPSLWLSDLRSKQWIPSIEDDESTSHHVPSPELVRELVDPSWLEANRDGADFLVQHFGLDALEVRLLAAAKDEEARQKLRDSLARIVEVVGNNAEMIDDLANKAEQRGREVDRMRRLGLAVQECVKRALERQGFDVDEIDHGYDFDVAAVKVREDDPEDLSAYFEIAEYNMEVKTTTTGEARLTPLQAATCAADSGKFVLCVVDLRGYEADVHQVDWTTADVSDRCKLLSGENLPIDQTLTFVRSAEGGEVPIRNVSSLRYAVRPALWENGLDFDEWVKEAFAN